MFITHADSTTEHSFKMELYCSVFQAETAAIMHSAIKLSTQSNQFITFWNDSLSSLQALSKKLHKSKSIQTATKHSLTYHTITKFTLRGLKLTQDYGVTKRLTNLRKLDLRVETLLKALSHSLTSKT